MHDTRTGWQFHLPERQRLADLRLQRVWRGSCGCAASTQRLHLWTLTHSPATASTGTFLPAC